MRITLPIILLTLAVLGCGRFGAGTETGSNAAKTNAAPASAGKAVDMPSLVGKSPEDIKKIVGTEPRFETPYLSFDLPQGTLTVDYAKGKQTTIGFDAKAPGFDSAEKLGDVVGIDVKGKTESNASGEYHYYEGLGAGGKALPQVTFHKAGDKFDHVSIDVEPLF